MNEHSLQTSYEKARQNEEQEDSKKKGKKGGRKEGQQKGLPRAFTVKKVVGSAVIVEASDVPGATVLGRKKEGKRAKWLRWVSEKWEVKVSIFLQQCEYFTYSLSCNTGLSKWQLYSLPRNDLTTRSLGWTSSLEAVTKADERERESWFDTQCLVEDEECAKTRDTVVEKKKREALWRLDDRHALTIQTPRL